MEQEKGGEKRGRGSISGHMGLLRAGILNGCNRRDRKVLLGVRRESGELGEVKVYALQRCSRECGDEGGREEA